MSNKLQIALIQMNSGEWDARQNVDKAVDLIRKAAAIGAELVVLPECFNNPYVFQYRDYKYMDYAESANDYTISTIREQAKVHGIYVIATIFEVEGPGFYYNSAFVIGPDGEILGKNRKIHPAGVRSLEKIYFRPGNRFPIFEIRGWKVGIVICYDLFFPETARASTIAGAELIVGPFGAPKQPIWDHLMTVRAWENGVYLASCNKVGSEGDWVFDGNSLIVNPMGEIVARANGQEDEILLTELDRQQVFQARRDYPMMRDRRPEVYKMLSIPEEDVRRLI